MSNTNYFGSSYTPRDFGAGTSNGAITDLLSPIDTTHFAHFDVSTQNSTTKYTWQIESPQNTDQWTLKYEYSGGSGDWGHNSLLSWYHGESNGVITIYDGNGTAQISFTESSAFSGSSGSSGSGPTVTEITLEDPPFDYDDGVNQLTVEGEIVSDDTIVTSDVTLTKDGVAYANSNLTLFNNKFEITKSGNAVYGIECGGVTNYIIHSDGLGSITSGSSTRTTNAIRIRDVIAKVPDNLKMYVRIRNDPSASNIGNASWSKWYRADRSGVFHGIKLIDYEDIWVRYIFSDDKSWTRIFQFQLANMTDSNGNNQIGGTFRVHRYFKNGSGDRLHFYTTPHEIGSSSMVLGPIGSNESSTATTTGGTGHYYDQWFMVKGSSVNPYSHTYEYQLAVDDWIYHQEPEGDDTGPPNDPDPPHDSPAHQFPGEWPMRRRRAHSFW